MAHRIRDTVEWLSSFLARHAYAGIAGAVVIGLGILGAASGWRDLLLTPDQRGAWAMHEGRYQEAADAFVDPMRRGVALFRAGAFKEAAQALSGLDTAEAAYDQGNALVMLGQYDNAVGRYDRALQLRPGWAEAEANRTLARLRADRLKTTGGDMGDTDSRPDEVVFDPNKPKGSEGKDDQVAGGTPMSDEAVRALWLRGVQTKPADFLRAKFAYQLQSQSTPPNPGSAP
ncbi:tetratricopeptide repeat protein [Microvirga lotononidis]|uniref:Tetratricopeptide repeat protein n=1 Tax=Microvirga lotononidis TaxID=864069 RepID=I4YN30_9HYPH|nr:tetratricopeptide repeat protein [Microvirga lotononidis]EIM25372.1 tetratricopeptide repeat protein [Microvirga lotononidis]WQO27329.1 tetratricopeptide repeat protein [Microvirga lotononidis]